MPEPDSWIRAFRGEGRLEAHVRLACFPHAGGACTFFHPFARTLSPEVEVLSVQYPGRQDRRHEECLRSLHDLADAAAARLSLWCDKPIALLGHSMGATIAFEVARRLESNGLSPLVLFASARRAPRCSREENELHKLADASLISEIRNLYGAHSKLLLDDEIVKAVLPALRADYTAIETYRSDPSRTLTTPIHVLLGREDSRVSPEEADEWRLHTTGSFEVTRYPGGHFYISDALEQVSTTILRKLEHSLRV